MADAKLTGLAAISSLQDDDLLYIVRDPSGTPVSKKITVKNFVGTIPSNTAITGRTSLVGNTTISCSNTVISSNVNITSAKGPKINAGVITLAAKTTVSSNNATTVLGAGGLQGSIFWDANYIYVATANNQIKRAALSSF